MVYAKGGTRQFPGRKIRQTDAVLIGGGSGLSSATEYKINIVGKEM